MKLDTSVVEVAALLTRLSRDGRSAFYIILKYNKYSFALASFPPHTQPLIISYYSLWVNVTNMS